ncbi:cysteine-rich PDZ-binding protein [Condylostylus longicornis]|uniref:cysteine-rich PDZ-binding protein n=1 Tax=Condylostylus longicornis TaxID=2530218 RepID=UPI00244E1A3C|nr:cysteine-rich PDZ-binding protein [Condylostylus longicornis]
MVCEKCEAKLSRIATPEVWKNDSKRKINENKALSSARAKFNPLGSALLPCRICRQKCHQAGSHYCQQCAYKKGICAMCGKKLLNTKNYKQSSA